MQWQNSCSLGENASIITAQTDSPNLQEWNFGLLTLSIETTMIFRSPLFLWMRWGNRIRKEEIFLGASVNFLETLLMSTDASVVKNYSTCPLLLDVFPTGEDGQISAG